MTILPAIALGLSITVCAAEPAPAPQAADSLRALYARGVPFDAFLSAATQRRELWDEHWAASRLEEADRRRAAALPGVWYLLAVTVPSCSDSIGSLPYLVRLADAVPGIEFRVVDADVGRFVLERHPAPDGRRATPTVLLLDAEFRLAGCWIEQPAELAAWWRENDRPDAPLEERLRIKMGWYERDAGRATLDLTLEILEAAAAGRRICPGAEAIAPRPADAARLEAAYRARIDSARTRFTGADVRFVTGMIDHHAQAIAMAHLAASHGASREVRALAARIHDAQTDEIALLRDWLRARNPPAPDASAEPGDPEAPAHGAGHAGLQPGMLSPEQMRALDRARGPEFDRLFLLSMIQHHRGAITMVRELLATHGAAQDPTLARIVTEIEADQSAEILRMARLLTELASRREPR